LCQPPNKQLQPTVIPRHVRAASAPFHYALAARWTAHRAAAEQRRYAMTYQTLLLPLLLACSVLVPQLSRAQACEWDRFPEPPAGVDVIEVLRHGGYPTGRTLVSVDASGSIVLLARGQCPDQALRGRLATPTFDELVDEFRPR
jgi:hypothetical protein